MTSTRRTAVIVGLLEPGLFGTMKKVLDFNTNLYGAVRQTVLMTDVTPWLYIGVLVGGSAKWLVDAMNEQSIRQSADNGREPH